MRRMTLLMIGILVVGNSTAAEAAVKPGQSCKKENQRAINGETKLVCTKMGKKLIWKKVASPNSEVATPNPAKSPEKPVVAEVEFTSSAEAKLQTRCQFQGSHVGLLEGPAICGEQNGQKIWLLITKEMDSVASRAHRVVIEKYKHAPDGNLAMDIRMDPNTPSWGKKIEKGMYAAARFWGTSPSGSTPLPTLISADLSWWPAQLDSVGDPGKDDYLKRLAANPCNAGFHGGPNPFWSFAFRENSCLSNVGFKQVPAHEYTHYAQGVLTDSISRQKPRIPWMEEGLASFIGGALGVVSDMGSDLRFGWAADLRGNQVDLNFFSKDERSVYDSPRWGDIYPIGAIAVEGLVALIGIDGVLSFYSEIKNGSTTDQAMSKVFGLTVAQSAQLLDGYVDSVRAKKEWSLQKLESEWEAAQRN